MTPPSTKGPTRRLRYLGDGQVAVAGLRAAHKPQPRAAPQSRLLTLTVLGKLIHADRIALRRYLRPGSQGERWGLVARLHAHPLTVRTAKAFVIPRKGGQTRLKPAAPTRAQPIAVRPQGLCSRQPRPAARNPWRLFVGAPRDRRLRADDLDHHPKQCRRRRLDSDVRAPDAARRSAARDGGDPALPPQQPVHRLARLSPRTDRLVGNRPPLWLSAIYLAAPLSPPTSSSSAETSPVSNSPATAGNRTPATRASASLAHRPATHRRCAASHTDRAGCPALAAARTTRSSSRATASSSPRAAYKLCSSSTAASRKSQTVPPSARSHHRIES